MPAKGLLAAGQVSADDNVGSFLAQRGGIVNPGGCQTIMSEGVNQDPVIQCYHCGNRGKSRLVAHYLHTVGLIDAIPGDEYSGSVAWEELYELHKCGACDKINVRCVTYHSYPGDPESNHYFSEEVKTHILFPPVEELPLGVPQTVGHAYTIAAKVEKTDAELFGMSMRRVLEEVCLDRGVRGKNLEQKLNRLAEMEGMPKAMASVGNYLRLLGNLGAHPEAARLTESEVPIIGALCRAILLYVYTPPHLAKIAEESYKRMKGSTHDGGAQGTSATGSSTADDVLASLFEVAGKRVSVQDETEISSAPRVVVLTGEAEADRKLVADAKAKRAEDERRLGHSITLIVIDP